MSIAGVFEEFGKTFGVEELSFSQAGLLTITIDGVGILSCEQVPDGVLIALFVPIDENDTGQFMKRALDAVNPILHTNIASLRPVLHDTMAGFVVPMEEESITVASLRSTVDTLHRAIQNAFAQ